jgi:hypothetical protein
VVEGFFALIEADLQGHDGLTIADRTGKALGLLRDATRSIAGADINVAGSAAVEYLRLFALVSMGWMWTRMAVAAQKGESPLHRSKLALADFFALKMLAQAHGLAASIEAGQAPVMALAADDF